MHTAVGAKLNIFWECADILKMCTRLCWIQHAYKWSRGGSPHFLNLGTRHVSGQLHAPATLLQGEPMSDTHWVESGIGPKADGNAAAKIKKQFLNTPGIKAQFISPQPSHSAEIVSSSPAQNTPFPISRFDLTIHWFLTQGTNRLSSFYKRVWLWPHIWQRPPQISSTFFSVHCS